MAFSGGKESAVEIIPSLFPRSLLAINGFRITPQGLTLVAAPTARFSCCPTCGQRSVRIHSRYDRLLQDLPAHGRAIHIELQLRRFFCDLPDCPQGTFAEQLPQIARPHARKTVRLIQALEDVAFTAGGEAGARLASQLHMPTSGDTLLRLMRRTATPAYDAPSVLGVDDWAIRRGQTYGTILCDLELRKPVDLLPERSSEAFATWLSQHPGAQIISRDRGGDYAKGAASGAPDAVQVADRWHLLHNLTDALQRAVDRRSTLLGEVAKEVAVALVPVAPASLTAQPPPTSPTTPELTRADQKKQDRRNRRLARYQQVQELRRQGMGIRKISRTLNISRQTVERFARCDQFPERATPTRRPACAQPIDPYLPFLQQRWQEGCDNAAQLWQEIKTKGFAGSVYMVRRQIRRWRRAAGLLRSSHSNAAPRLIRPSARRIAWLALGHVREPTVQDQAILKGIYGRWPELAETAELCRQFHSLLKEHAVDSLEAWMQLAELPGILPEVRRFAEVLRQDWAAVVEAVRQPWSQGQVEGQINVSDVLTPPPQFAQGGTGLA
jgi:transposase